MNAVDTSLTGKNAVQLISGNHACALGAIAAGCRFFAGYPITPSSEIAERLARRLPEVDGVFVQMEDEIASMAAVIGASMGGVKAMTATSGPGFSLKQENLGYAAGAEIPCVIVNVMRGGPSTGMPTRPSQADMMQARWGSHGDYPIIVLAPASVREIYSETIRAFDLAETLPHAGRAAVRPGDRAALRDRRARRRRQRRRVERKWASGPRADLPALCGGSDGIPGHGAPGRRLPHPHHRPDPWRERLPDAEAGSGHPQPVAAASPSSSAHRDADRLVRSAACDDADVVIVAIGISARAAHARGRAAAARKGCASACSGRSRCGRSRKRRCARPRPARAPCWCRK